MITKERLPRLRWFLDTEFEDKGDKILPISIGLISEDGAEHYWEVEGYNRAKAPLWIKENVLPKLHGGGFVENKKAIAQEIGTVLLNGGKTKPEVWAYYAAYDWVVLSSMFGGMLSLPDGIPQYCKEFMQLLDDEKIPPRTLPKQDATTKHNALEDAKWLRNGFLYVKRG